MKSKPRCDGCANYLIKVHRRYKAKCYCDRCYGRLFKHAVCPGCGKTAKLFTLDVDAVCQACEANHPCIRCGKEHFSLGKLTAAGPVCNSCSPYFRQAEPCQACGAMSQKLSRISRLGGDLRLCPRCASQDYATCQACHHYRLLQVADDGRLLCTACRVRGNIICPHCGGEMPAGRGQQCEPCYWTGALQKRLSSSLTAFKHENMRVVFDQFGKWLLQEIGPRQSALKIRRFWPFFVAIDVKWKKLPSYAALVEHFGAERLRRVRLPMRWMSSQMQVNVNAEQREADSEKRRINAMFANFDKPTLTYKALATYRDHLMLRQQKGTTTLRSVRLALSPAAALLRLVKASGVLLPTQTILKTYLRHAPGQRAALTGFINWINKKHSLGLVLKKGAKKIAKKRKRTVENQLLEMLLVPEESEVFQRRWLSLGLVYFHRLPKRAGNSLGDENIVLREDGHFGVLWREQRYLVPHWQVMPML
mgnify:CR=1 FL=1